MVAQQRLRARLRRSPALRAVVVANRHRGLRADDVFVASYPRSGNTWVRFLLADLATGAQVDFESVDRLIPNVGQHVKADRRRLIKTHEPYRSEYRRAIYLVRDVRDVLVSWYRVTRAEPAYESELDAFTREFMTARASPYGRWADHVRSWRAARDAGVPILVRRFEDLSSNPAATLADMAEFAGVPADDERVSAALVRTAPDEMRRLEHASLDYLGRTFGRRSLGVGQGVTGSWRELLSEAQLRVLEPALRLNRELGYSA